MTNLDSILKSRDITLLTKVCLVKAMVFPVVMYGCESWIVKKAEHQRIDAFELWCWRRLLRIPWTARRSNQSILKEISPGISLEVMMLRDFPGGSDGKASAYNARDLGSIPVSGRYPEEGNGNPLLKLRYFGHFIQRVDSLEKTLMLGRIGGKRRRGRQDEMAGWHH